MTVVDGKMQIQAFQDGKCFRHSTFLHQLRGRQQLKSYMPDADLVGQLLQLDIRCVHEFGASFDIGRCRVDERRHSVAILSPSICDIDDHAGLHVPLPLLAKLHIL
jgi:hypothetical protein